MSGHEKPKAPRAPSVRDRVTDKSQSPISPLPPAKVRLNGSISSGGTGSSNTSNRPNTRSNSTASSLPPNLEDLLTDPTSLVEDPTLSPSPLSSSTSSLAEKDKRINDLESEISKMNAEFEKELTHLSHALSNSSESLSFWQSKHSSLNQLYISVDASLRLLRQELSSREERDRDIKTRVSSLMLDRDAFREAYNEAMGELKEKDDEVATLREQVRGLKSWVSTSSRGEEQVTDESFGEGWRRLGNGLQNWVIVNFRRAKIDIEKASDGIREHMLSLVPTYEPLASSSKVHLIQSLVSSLLVEGVFQEYFVGLPKEQADELKKAEALLGTYGSEESMNQWRSATLAIIRKEATQKLDSETKAIVDHIINQVNSVLNAISDVQSSEGRDQSLRVLFNSAIDLARLLRVQKAVFTIVMPVIEGHQRTVFNSETMEDIGGEDEETLQEREIQCVTFPGIIKSGDENGEQGHLKNVVAKIRVLCAPD